MEEGYGSNLHHDSPPISPSAPVAQFLISARAAFKFGVLLEDWKAVDEEADDDAEVDARGLDDEEDVEGGRKEASGRERVLPCGSIGEARITARW